MKPAVFSYAEAFSRNLGWVTREEQQKLRDAKIAIAGLGGVGGVHLVTLARLGIGRFSLADFDTFDIANFNRQAGALISTIGLPKIDVMRDMARDINPELEIATFPRGIDSDNADEFLDGVSVYIDGLDFFAFSVREMLYEKLAEKRIPAVIAAPLGMGVAIINFLPGRMTFEEFFHFSGCSEEEKALRFLVGLSPTMLQRSYLVDRSFVDFRNRKGPSTSMSCQLCAGFAATEAVKLILGRGRILSAPWGLHFDPYRYRLQRTWRPRGNHNPLQKLVLSIVRRQIALKKG